MKDIEWKISDMLELSDQVIYGTSWQMYFEHGQLSKKTILTQQNCLMFDRERSHYERTVISWLLMIFTIFDSKILKTKIKNKSTKWRLKRTQIKICQTPAIRRLFEKGRF